MDFSATSIVNDALALAGCHAFTGADAELEDHPLYRTFENMLRNILSLHAWTFSKTTSQLALDPAYDAQRYAYAFHLPPASIGDMIDAWADRSRRNPLRDFEIEGSHLLADEPAVWLTWQSLPTLDRWPGHFRQLVVTATAAQYALQEREDKTLHDRLWSQAFGTPGEAGRGGMFRTAATRDNQMQTSPSLRIGPDPLTSARWSSAPSARTV